MNSVIGALRVVLGLDTAAFEKGAAGAPRTLSKLGKSLQNFGASMTTYVTAPLAAAGGAITAALSGISSDISQLQNSAKVANTVGRPSRPSPKRIVPFSRIRTLRFLE